MHSRRVHPPGPPFVDDCPCCADDYGRDLLEAALRALPTRAARELRAVVKPLDEVFLARVRPDPAHNGREEWWTHGL
ncbi:hypothetical protein ACFU7Y_02740 [Kitasatospora sp. NPDC057542]|uniref:hypothetical protein n=1 Tax=Streptomycetaceae TaxID=2062 RepID=UPI001CCB30C2|nr:hypothetical protein [Streptomyces sp. LS1784]